MGRSRKSALCTLLWMVHGAVQVAAHLANLKPNQPWSIRCRAPFAPPAGNTPPFSLALPSPCDPNPQVHSFSLACHSHTFTCTPQPHLALRQSAYRPIGPSTPSVRLGSAANSFSDSGCLSAAWATRRGSRHPQTSYPRDRPGTDLLNSWTES